VKHRDPWAWAGIAIVGLTAMIWSFDALSDLARMVGVTTVVDTSWGWHLHVAWGLPITVDVLAVVATRVWLRGTAPDAAIAYACRAAWSAIAASIAGNGYHGLLVGNFAIDALIVSAVPAVVLGAVVHLAVLVGRSDATRPTDEGSTKAEIAGAEETAGVPVLTAALARAWVYRLVDAEGALLYVGITQNLSSRLANHRRSKSWWPEVANVETEVFATRREGLAAEAKAIFEEGPRYNLAPGTYADAALIAELNRAAAGEKPSLPDRRDAVDTDSRAAICDDLQAIARRTGRQFTQDEVKTMYGIGTDKAAWARRQLGWWPQAVDGLEVAR
jgi:hypothetical protein